MRYKKGAVHPELYRFFENSGTESFENLMTRLTENEASSTYRDNSDGLISCIVLSGYKSGNNTGTSTEPIDGRFDGEDFRIIVVPRNKMGSFFGSLEDFFSKTEEEITQGILTVGTVYRPKADYGYDASSPVNFGQRIECYFEDGSESNSDFRNMVFKSPPEPPVYDEEVMKAVGNIPADTSTASSFNSSSPTTLGNLSEGGLDPRYPPRQWIYVGSNSEYNGQRLQNGNLPGDLLGKATKGGKYKPQMLAELVNEYDRMCEDFRKEFPSKQLSAWGYRPYSRQLSLKNDPKTANLAAKPGTSNHGWGQAVDIHFYEDGASEYSKLRYSKPEYIWLKENSQKYGWYNPPWATQGAKSRGVRGAKEEPWHWESTPSKFKRS